LLQQKHTIQALLLAFPYPPWRTCFWCTYWK